MSPAPALAASFPRSWFASLDYESKLAHDSCLPVGAAACSACPPWRANFFGVLSGILNDFRNARLILRPFREEDVAEPAQAVCDHAFRDLNLPRVIPLIHPEKAASRSVAEKIGMQFERKTVFKGFPALVSRSAANSG